VCYGVFVVVPVLVVLFAGALRSTNVAISVRLCLQGRRLIGRELVVHYCFVDPRVRGRRQRLHETVTLLPSSFAMSRGSCRFASRS